MYSQDVAILWQFQSRDNFSSAAKTVRLYLYELPRRLANRVSSSSALSEARRIFLRYLHCINIYSKCIRILHFYARVVVELELRYVQRPLYIYHIYIYIYIYKIAASCTARSRSPITGAAHTVIPIQRQHAHKIAISVYTYT